ncbi:LOW QUALITY PROTEIN: MAPK regulated corepressor interacting protein 2 [Manduca sexta]|uniref:LOW QUALITY PROTEIN: MAPK regulated corepressor interacting protein 2 n=1 Tax=Manduca sexta TaxID=7130 RepID=UPI00188DDFD7|nr:LOW QUALITY PROTEIN: MAPK regulated corepressor interacting protein 2 [Manduca sexta]
MYTVSKGPSKIVAKTRRGLSQNLERLDSRKDHNRKSSESDNGEVVNMPKPIFHLQWQKKRHYNQRIQHHVITPQHEEIIRFISETWTQSAYGESEPSSPTSTIGSGSSSPAPPSNLYYQDDAPSPILRDFKPFDLETWWGKRLFQNITSSL